MTRYARGYRIQGHSMNRYSGEMPQEDTTPVQPATYTCERGCEFTVPLSIEAAPPTGWECRCGGMARLDGAPEDTRPQAPGYGPCEWQTRGQRGPKPHWEHIRERRSIPDLEALLAESLATIRQAGAAR